jgi:hypothetical protein
MLFSKEPLQSHKIIHAWIWRSLLMVLAIIAAGQAAPIIQNADSPADAALTIVSALVR